MKFKYDLKRLLGKPSTPSQVFHDLTKMKNLPKDLPTKEWPKEWSTIYYKEYPRLDKIFLPDPELDASISLKDILVSRQSRRDFSKIPLGINDLSTLLYFSAGLKNHEQSQHSMRFYPSGGARFPLEIYIISQNSDLPEGLYHYNVRSHYLEVLLQDKKINTKKLFTLDWFQNAPIIIIFTAIFNRNQMKYRERGYRHILSETGHLAQNFYLVAESLDLGLCPTGGYADDRINEILDIDGLDESVVYTIALGNRKS